MNVNELIRKHHKNFLFISIDFDHKYTKSIIIEIIHKPTKTEYQLKIDNFDIITNINDIVTNWILSIESNIRNTTINNLLS